MKRMFLGEGQGFCDGETDIEKVFQHFFSQHNLFSTLPHSPWAPPTDVYETPDSYVIRMEICGIEDINRDVEIELNQNVLTVKGYRRDRCADTKIGFHQMEIHYGYFERVITLPHAIDSESRRGCYNDGFLVISVGKSTIKRRAKRRIDVKP